MKKLWTFVIAGIILLVLVGCGNSGIPINIVPSSAPIAPTQTDDKSVQAEIGAKEFYVGQIGIKDDARNIDGFHRVKDLADGASLSENLNFLHILPETVIPSYYEELDDIFFPAELELKGIERETEIHEIALDSTGISDYVDLAGKIRRSLGDLLDGYVLLQQESDVFEAQSHLTQAEIDTRARNGRMDLFFFRQSAFGLAIDSLEHDEGALTVRFRDEKLTIPKSSVCEFVPYGNEYIRALPLSDAVSIAENTRTSRSAVRVAQLVYTAIPDVFGDDNYHLCWRIAASSTYYIGCENGEKWCADNSE
jgi:hypothetical protein